MLPDVVIRRNVEVSLSLGKGFHPVARSKGSVSSAFTDITVVMELRVEGRTKTNAASDHARRVMVGIIPYRRNAVPRSCLWRASIYNSALAFEVAPSPFSGRFNRC